MVAQQAMAQSADHLGAPPMLASAKDRLVARLMRHLAGATPTLSVFQQCHRQRQVAGTLLEVVEAASFPALILLAFQPRALPYEQWDLEGLSVRVGRRVDRHATQACGVVHRHSSPWPAGSTGLAHGARGAHQGVPGHRQCCAVHHIAVASLQRRRRQPLQLHRSARLLVVATAHGRALDLPLDLVRIDGAAVAAAALVAAAAAAEPSVGAVEAAADHHLGREQRASNEAQLLQRRAPNVILARQRRQRAETVVQAAAALLPPAVAVAVAAQGRVAPLPVPPRRRKRRRQSIAAQFQLTSSQWRSLALVALRYATLGCR